MTNNYYSHAHYYAQYVDGLLGAFIIHDPDDPYLNDYDEEYTVILNDWHHTESSVLVDWYMSLDSDGDEPMPDIGLINGKNKYNCSLVSEGSQCVDVELEKFTFVYGKRYRLRIINASAFAAFFFSIDNHYLDVIEVEGTYVERYTVTCIPINAGQRYSVIVTADQEISNYWMRSAFHMGFYSSRPSTLEVYNKAIIHYEGADGVDPETGSWDDSTMLDWWDLDQLVDLKPYYFEPLPENTHTLVLALACTDDDNEVSMALVNGSSFTPDYNASTLDRVYNRIQEYDSRQNIYSFIYYGQVVDVIIINYDGGEHPFHMHSHKFWVIGSERFFTDYGISPENLNFVDPIQRDTVTVPEAGWAIIRFIVDSPGVWAFHCHIEWHVEAGLVAQFVELPDMIAQMNPPEEWKNLCKNQTTTITNQDTSFSL
ncbi:8583_t:CDS:2, partial [Acaulospora morrowiae]